MNTASISLRPRRAAMTLVEVVVALGVLSISIGGIFAVLMQSRRLATQSVAQNTALTIAQGYIEQIKNIPLQQFVNASPTDKQNNPNLTVSYVLPTLKDQSTTVVQLTTTPSTIDLATLTGGTAGTTPTGVVDNLQTFDMDSQSTPLTTTWTAAWPGANTLLTPYPATAPGKTDLRMNFWIQITDLTPTSSAKCKAYGVTLVYTWQYLDGQRWSYGKDVLRTIRSAVQTF